MRGNYKVRVRVPIYATAEVEYIIYNAESEAAALAEAQERVDEPDIGHWFADVWTPNKPIPTLAEVIEFEATETETPNEKEGSTE